MDLTSWAVQRQQRRTSGAKTSSKSWRIPASLVALAVCFLIWQHHGFVPALLIAGVFGVVYRLDAIIKRLDNKGAPRGWYPGPSGEDERYWNGHEWADLPARPLSR
jgi:hypothetical protein